MLQFFRPKHTIAVAPSSIIFTLFFLLGMYFLFTIRSILMLLFLAFILMTALNPGVKKLHVRYKIPRLAAIFIMYILMFSIIGLVIAFVVPPLVSQLQNLIKTLEIPILSEEIQGFRFDLAEINSLANSLGSSVETVFSLLSTAFNGLFTLFTLFVITFFMLVERNRLHLRIGWITREKKHMQLAAEFLDKVEHQLGGWIRGQLILMTIVGVLTYIGLFALSVPYALPLALITGLLNIVPNLGPIIASVPGIAIAMLSGGPLLAGGTALVYLVVQQFESNLIVPKVMKDNADVSPLATIVSILIGLQVAEVAGALLAVPIYIVLRTVYAYWVKSHPIA